MGSQKKYVMADVRALSKTAFKMRRSIQGIEQIITNGAVRSHRLESKLKGAGLGEIKC